MGYPNAPELLLRYTPTQQSLIFGAMCSVQNPDSEESYLPPRIFKILRPRDPEVPRSRDPPMAWTKVWGPAASHNG